MDNVQKTPSAETLRQMPYSELKKIAKQHGIKGNLKADKIIAALTLIDSDDTDSFSTPAAKVMNSSKKKKLEKFDEDSTTPLDTPRRGTYSIGSPIALKLKETLPSSHQESSVLEASNIILDKGLERKCRRNQQNELSLSLVTNEVSVLDMSNVTVGRGSERKSRKHKQNEISPSSTANELSVLDISNATASVINESSVLDVSNVTIGRGSERKLRNRKVSFLSPVMTPHTPKNSILKMRPKTPIVSRTPLAAGLSPFPECKVNLGPRIDTSLHVTPLPVSSNSLMNKNELSKKKRLATPNFKKIHEKAFEKMESIEDYQKRVVSSAKKLGVNFKANKVTKAKSRIPAFGGIPFIPSVSRSTVIKFDAAPLNKIKKVEEKKIPKKKDVENITTKNKTKFDLKASLSRKLGYKPYTGPLKPLTPSSVLNTSSALCDHKTKYTPAKEPVNKVVSINRKKNRSVLKGVRTNKRFELQMKNRMLQ